MRATRQSILGLMITALVISSSAWAARSFAGVTNEEPVLSPAERRERIRPIFEQLLRDPRLGALEQGFNGRTDDARQLDNYLRFLPISPLEVFQLDIERKQIDLPVPYELSLWHDRWIQLHEKEALELYGQAAVARALGRTVLPDAPEPGPKKVPAALEGLVSVGANRNMAAAFTSPAPLEYQGEVQVAVNPTNSSQIVAVANSWDTLCGNQRTLAIFYSWTNGDAWTYTCAPPPSAFEPPDFPACTGLGLQLGADPILTWVRDADLFLTYLLVCRVSSEENWSALVVARSGDHGASWQPHGIIKNSWPTKKLEDRPHYAVDRNPDSLYFNRHYVCWDTAAPLANQQKTSYSTDGGKTWSPPLNVPAVSPFWGNVDLACDFAIGEDGAVHLIWDRLLCAGNYCDDERMYHTKSTNGGASWSAPVMVQSFSLSGFSGTKPNAQDDRGIGPFGAIDIDRSGGPCDGTLYVTYGEAGAGGYQNYGDIFVQTSANGGQTWLPPVKVNDDGGSTLQFHPTLAVDQQYGTVAVAWHDARHDPNQYGEYLGLVARDGQALVSWSDTRHTHPNSLGEPQQENLAFARVTFNTQTKVFVSDKYLDGYVIESSENSNAGGTASWSGHLRVGDVYSAADGERQVKGILSFDTSALPDGAPIQSARIDLWDIGLPVGSNPWTSHGPCYVDVDKGPISLSFVYANAIQVEPGDFQASVTAPQAGTLLKGASRVPYTGTLSAAGLAAINPEGLTQMRIWCTLDDNDDNGSDYIELFDGGWAPAPKLTVTY